jgi:hypothetical protein
VTVRGHFQNSGGSPDDRVGESDSVTVAVTPVSVTWFVRTTSESVMTLGKVSGAPRHGSQASTQAASARRRPGPGSGPAAIMPGMIAVALGLGQTRRTVTVTRPA